MKDTEADRARHGASNPTSADMILSDRIEAALAARLSQLEGSTRAALLRMDKRINVHDGDLAEQLERMNATRDQIQAIEVGLEQSDFMREADAAPIGRPDYAIHAPIVTDRRIDERTVERTYSPGAIDPTRLDVLEASVAKLVASHEGMGEIDLPEPMVTEITYQHAVAEREGLRDALASEKREAEAEHGRSLHFRAKLTEAREEQERDLADLFEALGGEDATEPRPRTTARHAWQALIEQTRRVADALREEQGARRAAEGALEGERAERREVDEALQVATRNASAFRASGEQRALEVAALQYDLTARKTQITALEEHLAAARAQLVRTSEEATTLRSERDRTSFELGRVEQEIRDALARLGS